MARFNKLFTKKLFLPDGKDKNQLDKTSQITTTATEINTLDGATTANDTANKVAVVGTGGNLTVANDLTVTGQIDSGRGTPIATNHGAGAQGTGLTLKTYQYNDMGHIFTDINVDITGLGCKGDAEGDVIGLPSGGAAYIGKYDLSTWGIIYRVDIINVEAPGEGTATITPVIHFVFSEDDTLTYDDPSDAVAIYTPFAGMVPGDLIAAVGPKMTTGDCIYLTEGDTAASTGIYNAGQYTFRFFGHPVLT